MLRTAALAPEAQVLSPRSARRSEALLGILAVFAPLVALGYVGTRVGNGTLLGGLIITLGYLLSVVIASRVLAVAGTGWRELGLAWPRSWPRTALLGSGAMVGAVLVIVAVQMLGVNLPGMEVAPVDASRFDVLTGNLPLFLLMVVLAWTTIAFGEELLFRAYLISRLLAVFQPTRARWVLAPLGSAVLFGLAHYVEGPLGIASNGAFGLLFGLIYLRTGRNLWVTIIGHGLLNTLRFALVFAGVAG
ncbi:MAG: hypothetical protein CL878_12480 [Dehalococcoidia bacterium]|nr:hypothetical protein [Dehalococcoidia bacterium]